MTALWIGGFLFLVGLAFTFMGSDGVLMIPGGLLFLVGLILQSQERTRREIALLRRQLEATDGRRPADDGPPAA
ncbi:hypothetical protein [Krasilnikoviella flava]|uniref:hypothetical protein n=1 Tax=Krasilnikoviella flava TaxID=526729 RepID=UPI00111C2A67|nr:hypothetical protein [Krasilnikoviella flava]